jgi:hypothetical protein
VVTLLAERKIAAKHSHALRRERFCQCDQQRRVAVSSCTVREHQSGRRVYRGMKESAYGRFVGIQVNERLRGGVDHDMFLDDRCSLFDELTMLLLCCLLL